MEDILLFSNFYDAVHYIFSTYTRSKPYRTDGLDKDTRTPEFTARLVEAVLPYKDLGPTIKVTGSKGKGSTSRLLAGILEAHGYKTGLFTSPHLLDFTERIRINGKAISEADFMRILSMIKPFADLLEKQMRPEQYFGPVGLTAVLAARYFQEQQTQVNVVELGRGARFDDVNRLPGEIGVITPIHLEHALQLGPTLRDIAWNKAGIFTRGMSRAFVGRQVPDVLRVLEDEAKQAGVVMAHLGQDMIAESVAIGAQGTRCSLRTPYGAYDNILLSLYGRHQADNLAVAVAAAEAIMGRACHEDRLRNFAASCTFFGRMQRVAGQAGMPDVFVDGAIHREAAKSIAEVVQKIVAAEKLHPVIAVLGVPKDKDYLGVIQEASTFSSSIIITKAKNPSLHFADDALERANEFGNAMYVGDVAQAVQKAGELASVHGLVVVLGTQSVVAETLAHLGVDTRNL